MTADELAQRLTTVESSLQQVQDAVSRLQTAPANPNAGPASTTGPALSPESLRLLDELEPYQKYLRQTGHWPPDTWRPGDPVPEPDWWA